eukprot:TRINITY_DN20648_c0_g1_i1.p1 TRINITY_DN20648_c0_g1~~TRINITY_DN20648_c0_g1_i1.p1  ORF type:complete len:641 (+),score=138.94 TRINITY_DN20648_c0_g1_i1:48-1925(+)
MGRRSAGRWQDDPLAVAAVASNAWRSSAVSAGVARNPGRGVAGARATSAAAAGATVSPVSATTAGAADCGASPELDQRSAAWESGVTFGRDQRELTVSMSGWGFSDQDMEAWCTWFRCYIPAFGSPRDKWEAREVNFAKNQLTAVGVRTLLETLAACRVMALVLKLHHNVIDDGGGVAAFLERCQGSLREIHLSHNELGAVAAAEIILAAAATKEDNTGELCYPRHTGPRGMAPLWLRLEQNHVDLDVLASHVEPGFKRLSRRGRALCNASSRGCTPHCCAGGSRSSVPAVHAKCLANQRSRPSTKSTTVSQCELPPPPTSAVDLARADAPLTAVLSKLAHSPIEDAEIDEVEPLPTGSTEPEVARVHRWDDALGRWCLDTIEIPALEVPLPQRTAPRRAEVADASTRTSMAWELKQLIGVSGARNSGGASKDVRAHQNDRTSLRARNGTAAMAASREVARKIGADAGLLALMTAGHAGAAKKLDVSSERGRNPRQPPPPLAATQARFNPNAKEFVPTVGSEQNRRGNARKVASLPEASARLLPDHEPVRCDDSTTVRNQAPAEPVVSAAEVAAAEKAAAPEAAAAADVAAAAPSCEKLAAQGLFNRVLGGELPSMLHSWMVSFS